MAGACVCGDEPTSFIKSGEYFDWVHVTFSGSVLPHTVGLASLGF